MDKNQKANLRKLRQRIDKLEKARDKHYKILQDMNSAIYKWSATTLPMVELGLQSTALMSLLLEKEISTADEVQKMVNDLHTQAQEQMEQEENGTVSTPEETGSGDTEATDTPTEEPGLDSNS